MTIFGEEITDDSVMTLTSRHRNGQHSSRPKKDLIFAPPHFLIGTKDKLPTLNFLSGFSPHPSLTTFASRSVSFVEKFTNKSYKPFGKLAKEVSPILKAKTPAKKFSFTTIRKDFVILSIMKKTNQIRIMNFTLLFTISLLLANCKKDCLENYKSVDFEVIEIGCCFFDDTSYIINEDSVYQAKLSLLNNNLPNIDFSKHTLIGKLMEGQCSESCYKIKDVCINENDKVISININHKTGNPLKCGCKKEFSTMNWLLIPKIPNNFDIKINIK